MIVTLQSERAQTLADVRAVIDGNDRLDYQFTDREAACEFIRRTLVRFDYPALSKPDKGVIRRYLAKMTGLSRAQMTRLVGQHRATGRVTDRRGGAPVRPFERRYTGADIRLLAEVDAALGDMSGPATRAVMRRELEVFGQRRLARSHPVRWTGPGCRCRTPVDGPQDGSRFPLSRRPLSLCRQWILAGSSDCNGRQGVSRQRGVRGVDDDGRSARSCNLDECPVLVARHRGVLAQGEVVAWAKVQGRGRGAQAQECVNFAPREALCKSATHGLETTGHDGAGDSAWPETAPVW